MMYKEIAVLVTLSKIVPAINTTAISAREYLKAVSTLFQGYASKFTIGMNEKPNMVNAK